jgi:hypothetical protein
MYNNTHGIQPILPKQILSTTQSIPLLLDYSDVTPTNLKINPHITDERYARFTSFSVLKIMVQNSTGRGEAYNYA